MTPRGKTACPSVVTITCRHLDHQDGAWRYVDNLQFPAEDGSPATRRDGGRQRSANTPRTVMLTVPLPTLIGVSAGPARSIILAAR